MRLESSIAIPNQDGYAVCRIRPTADHHQVHLAIFVPVHRGQSHGRRTSGIFRVRAKRAITVVNEDGNSIGTGIDRSQVGNMVAVEICLDDLICSSSDRIGLRGKALAESTSRCQQCECNNEVTFHEHPLGNRKFDRWDVRPKIGVAAEKVLISVLEIVYPLRRHSEECPRSGDPEEPCVSSSSPKGHTICKKAIEIGRTCLEKV